METTEKPNSFGQRVREIRLAQFLKGVELARVVGISTGYLHDIESSRTSPSLPLLTKIASALDVSADYLLGRTDVPAREETAAADDDLLVRVPLLDEELIKCGYCDSEYSGHFDNALHGIISYSRKFYTYSREELGGKYDIKHPPFAVRIKNADLARSGIPGDCVLIVNPALRPRPGEACLVSYFGSLLACRVLRCDEDEALLSTDTDTKSFKEPRELITVYGPVVAFRGRPKLLPWKDILPVAEAKQPESAAGISEPQPSEPDAQGDEPRATKNIR